MLSWAGVESFKRERELLLALLAALREPARAADLPAGDPMLLAVARHHRLTALLSSTCGKTLPPALHEVTRRDRIITTARGLVLAQAAAGVIRALQAAGIRSIVLKGLDYDTRLYGSGGLRPTGDVDILIPGAQRREAFGVLDGLGFEPRAAAPGFDEPDYHEVAWTRGEVEVDLHMALAPLARCPIDYAAVWDQAVPARIADTDALALALPHAAVFQALHMAIDHFDVPAIYLVDLSRLIPGPAERERALEVAKGWHCRRALEIAVSLTAAMIPSWPAAGGLRPSPLGRRVIAAYGGTARLPRPEQLLRKVLLFDRWPDAARYSLVQSRRNVREAFERRVRRRSARARLGL